MKFSIYLNRRVFVMCCLIVVSGGSLSDIVTVSLGKREMVSLVVTCLLSDLVYPLVGYVYLVRQN